MTDHNDTENIVIDPEAMNIVNRVAAGCSHVGNFKWVGGLMVEGRIEGDIEVTGGPIVLMPEGQMAGVIRGDGEAYLFGTITARSDTELSEVNVSGSVFIAETLNAKANITASSFKSYDGAQVEGRIKTMRRGA